MSIEAGRLLCKSSANFVHLRDDGSNKRCSIAISLRLLVARLLTTRRRTFGETIEAFGFKPRQGSRIVICHRVAREKLKRRGSNRGDPDARGHG